MCKYCEAHHALIEQHGNSAKIIDGSILQFSYYADDQWHYDTTAINYCPVCGEPLTERLPEDDYIVREADTIEESIEYIKTSDVNEAMCMLEDAARRHVYRPLELVRMRTIAKATVTLDVEIM